ncbi:alkaline phosphatase family protein [uncultured Parabacteroides sp.]|jgi:phosphoglycerol transferase MdoB-like AlkP superfamily enzyme|uniref:LTA synthase family protein n=1 Tax=uncultured Parabacteroides sp. TaxID=512312 RepID=UPI0025E93619|nr:alkaline phosphatase family protein [uncultured Parabacteroides sp.]
MSKRLIFLLAVFALWLPVFAIQKPLFMLYHALENSCSLTDYLQVILHGVLLDCTISGYLTVIPLLCVLVSIWLPGTVYKKILKGYFLIIAILVAAIYAVDVALYGYWGFRLDATLFFYLQSPKDAMASVPLKTFTLQLVMFAAYAWVIYWLFKRLIIPLFPSTPVRRRLGGTIVILLVGGILFIPIRGGVTTSTANVGMVYFSKNQFLNHAAINPTFSLIASMSKQQDFAAQFNFFPEEERLARYTTLTQHNDSLTNNAEKIELLTTDRPNILIILLESFTANAIEAVGGEAGITPNLNRLSKEGVTFTNMYANSFRTDRGLVAVLNGYLAQPTTSIMKYPAKSQTLPSIAKSLGEQGYTADMLYGGDINFTNMQSYFFGSGYSKITADRDFPLSSRLSKWGANDDITFSHLYESIKERGGETPWLSTFLTLSSHEPFEVPFHHLEDPYLNSVAFTDSCIGSFVDKLKELPVWKNTLIVLISDHGFRYPSPMLDYEPRRFHIPMIWLGGAVKEPAIIDTYANQTDLVSTLLSQLNLPHDQFTFSRDILDPGYPKYSFYTFSNGFGFIDSTGISVYDNESNKPLTEEPAKDSETRLNNGKVILQTLYDDLGNR